MPDQKKNANKVPRRVFRYVGTKTFTYFHQNWDFCPKEKLGGFPLKGYQNFSFLLKKLGFLA